jgi:hypothetical protein
MAKRKVLHKQLYRPGFGGGVVNTTLCRRVSNAQNDTNVANTDAEVTCKFCLPLIGTARDNGVPANYGDK